MNRQGPAGNKRIVLPHVESIRRRGRADFAPAPERALREHGRKPPQASDPGLSLQL
jgi:hypothetical protein